MSSSPAQGTKIPHVLQHGQKQKQKQKRYKVVNLDDTAKEINIREGTPTTKLPQLPKNGEQLRSGE